MVQTAVGGYGGVIFMRGMGMGVSNCIRVHSSEDIDHLQTVDKVRPEPGFSVLDAAVVVGASCGSCAGACTV